MDAGNKGFESRKKMIAGLIGVLIALALFAVTTQEVNAGRGGSCGKDGNNLTWQLNGDELTITGEGEMA